jgi:hypothetical protein
LCGVRTDPTDNGGLFVGRRPGTAPVRYRAVPERAGERRRHLDNVLAAAILVVMVLVAATFWGPIPMAWLWIGAQIQYATDSVSLGIFCAFLGMILTLLAGLALVKRLDQFWILVRRAGGHDQRKGMIGPVFATAAVIGTTAFVIWLLFIAGLTPSLAPSS